MRTRLCYMIAALGASLTAVDEIHAQPALSIEAETGNHLVDRGETLTRDYTQLNVAVEVQNDDTRAFVSLNRLAPIGRQAGRFGDEFEIAFGAGHETRDWAVQATIARIENPEDSSALTHEAGLSASLNSAFSPEIAMFYDLDTRDYGLEGLLTINGQWFGMDTAIQPKVGFVVSDAGDDRSYAELGVSISREITSHLQLQGFAATHASDQDSLIERTGDASIMRSKDTGTSLGFRLVAQH